MKVNSRILAALGGVAVASLALAGCAGSGDGGDAQGGSLTIWLDRFDTNEPVGGATIDVETPTGPETASAQPDGTYTLPATWAAKPGSYDLIFTVTSGTDVDLLTGTLQAPQVAALPVAAASETSTPVTSTTLIAAGVVGLAAAFDGLCRDRVAGGVGVAEADDIEAAGRRVGVGRARARREPEAGRARTHVGGIAERLCAKPLLRLLQACDFGDDVAAARRANAAQVRRHGDGGDHGHHDQRDQ